MTGVARDLLRPADDDSESVFLNAKNSYLMHYPKTSLGSPSPSCPVPRPMSLELIDLGQAPSLAFSWESRQLRPQRPKSTANPAATPAHKVSYGIRGTLVSLRRSLRDMSISLGHGRMRVLSVGVFLQGFALLTMMSERTRPLPHVRERQLAPIRK